MAEEAAQTIAGLAPQIIAEDEAYYLDQHAANSER